MQAKTKEEYIQALRALADKLETVDLPKDLYNPYVSISWTCMTKEILTNVMRELGGKWTKSILGGDNNYSFFVLDSATLPIHLTISRDKVCKRIVKFECEPMFS